MHSNVRNLCTSGSEDPRSHELSEQQPPQQRVPSEAARGDPGVIPFIAFSPAVAAALPLPADLVQNAALLQLGYGASIASFLGGVHWGMAMSEYGGTRPVTWRRSTVHALTSCWSSIFPAS